MFSVPIKVKADLVRALGSNLATTVLGFRRKDSYRRLPSSVAFARQKPTFYLNDGGTLDSYAVNLATGEVLGERYCGSQDTACNHPEQFAGFDATPQDHALVFVETFCNGKNTSWMLTVVSPNVPAQIAESVGV